MRPNKVGWVLVAFFGVGGYMFWRTIPQVWIGQIWMAVAAFLAILYSAMTQRAGAAARLAAQGARGVAHVLELEQTGMYVNNQPRVKLRLRIEAPGIAVFERTKTVTVPLVALGALQLGGTLPVAVDPRNPNRFMIDWFGNRAGPAMTFRTEGGRTVTLANDALTTSAVLDVFRRHGIRLEDGLDLRTSPTLRADVLAALEQAGHVDASPPLQSEEDPTQRIAILQELLDSDAITESEFKEHRRRILGDI